MERLNQSDPQSAVQLTDADRLALQEIEQKFAAKIAEREVFLQKRLDEARRERDREAVEQIEHQLRNEKARLRDEMEAAKNKIRSAAESRS